METLTLYPEAQISKFPRTRYQGSKRKLLGWIWENVSFLDFESVADLFGGTASVSYLFKVQGKRVAFNDILEANLQTGIALIENSSVKLAESDIEKILKPCWNEGFISRTFKGIYYYDDENELLDRVMTNIEKCYSADHCRKAMLLWTVFQSCLIKRPFNLFHRKNLNMRMRQVERSFGNKATWDAPFDYYIKKFAQEINQAVFDNGFACCATCRDASTLSDNFDLVYIDPPYLSEKGVGVDYRSFYHFLEGLCNYADWGSLIDYEKKHRPLKPTQTLWNDRRRVKNAFRDIIHKFSKSHLVISYRSDGIPSIQEIVKEVSGRKKNVRILEYANYRYVLSTNGNSSEILIVAWD